MKNKTLYYHIGGVIFTVILGSFLHFAYKLSGFWKPVALFGGVNESTWEHLKIAFWPAFIFVIIEYFAYGRGLKNFCFAKTKQLYITPFLIIILFYGYTALIEHNLFLDIFIFMLAIIIGYVASYKILLWQRDFSKYRILAICFIAVAVLAFSLFSFFPLKNFLFLDPVTSLYGIIKDVKTINSFEECASAGFPVMESYPRQCRAADRIFTEDIGNELEKTDLIRADNPRPNTTIKSPLEASGQARGFWFFEASFPVILTDWDGKIIAQTIATAQGDWLTESFVPFTATLEFENPYKEGVPDFMKKGNIIFKKDNPSGLPEYDDALEFPVFFE